MTECFNLPTDPLPEPHHVSATASHTEHLNLTYYGTLIYSEILTLQGWINEFLIWLKTQKKLSAAF